MHYARVLRLPQYFRNLQRLGEIITVLVKHGFGDLVDRLDLFKYLETPLRLVKPAVSGQRRAAADFGERIRLVCEELGPTFIKLAQLISTRPNLFPEGIIRELRKLQDQVPPFPLTEAREIVQRELGATIESIFSSLEPLPLGSASVAQVHKARLRSGQDVVVKIQRPGLERIIETDLDILRGLAALLEERVPESLHFTPVNLVEELSRNLRHEADFRREAANIRKFTDNFSSEKALRVPKIYSDFTSRRVLTEEFIHGQSADIFAASEQGRRSGALIAQSLARIVMKSIFEDRFFHADPHPGNIIITPDLEIALVDFGLMGRLDRSRLDFVVRFLVSVFAKDAEQVVRLLEHTEMAPVNLDQVALRTQLHEIFDLYLSQDLNKLDLGQLLSDIFELVRRHGIKLTSDLILIGKSLVLLQTLGSQLDPEFVPAKVAQPYLKSRYQMMFTDPRLYATQIRQVSDDYRRLVSELPNEMRSILRKLARENLVINFSSKDMEALKGHQNRMLNRALMTVLGLAALAYGLILRVVQRSDLEMLAAYSLTALGALILVLVWFAIQRTGGTRGG